MDSARSINAERQVSDPDRWNEHCGDYLLWDAFDRCGIDTLRRISCRRLS